MADAADLKSVDESREGSSPSSGTNLHSAQTCDQCQYLKWLVIVGEVGCSCEKIGNCELCLN